MMNPYVGHSGLVAVLAGVCAFSAQAVERIDRCGDDAARGVWPGSAAMPVHRPATTDVPDRTPAVPAAVLSVASRIPDRLAPSAASAMTIAAIDGDDGDVPADIATIPSEDLRAGGDDKKRYFLIGRRDRAQVPDAGYALLVVLPGGDGGADFNPFVRRIYKYALNDRWLIAQVVAPRWNERQARSIVWPTERRPHRAARFTTEALIDAVIADVAGRVKVDRGRVFVFGWSSGGPACYAAALRERSPVAGAFVAMSVFKPKGLPSLDRARGKAFYLLQSPDDRVTALRWAVAAEKALRKAGATVKLTKYAGGHGWRGDVWGMIRSGVEWLESNAGRGP